MRVILVKDVPDLGEEGDIRDVTLGYARNYLFPQGLVVEDTPFNRNRLKEQRKRIELKKVKKREEAQKLAEKLASISINLPAAAHDNDKLFGAIHESDVQRALETQGYLIEKKNILMDEPIKNLGIYKVLVKIYEDIKAELKVWVVKE